MHHRALPAPDRDRCDRFESRGPPRHAGAFLARTETAVRVSPLRVFSSAFGLHAGAARLTRVCRRPGRTFAREKGRSPWSSRPGSHFWVAGDVLINTATGATQEVLRLVHSSSEASTFGEQTATNVMNFVASRVNNLQSRNPVKFEIEPSEVPQGLWVIHGIQGVEVDNES